MSKIKSLRYIAVMLISLILVSCNIENKKVVEANESYMDIGLTEHKAIQKEEGISIYPVHKAEDGKIFLENNLNNAVDINDLVMFDLRYGNETNSGTAKARLKVCSVLRGEALGKVKGIMGLDKIELNDNEEMVLFFVRAKLLEAREGSSYFFLSKNSKVMENESDYIGQRIFEVNGLSNKFDGKVSVNYHREGWFYAIIDKSVKYPILKANLGDSSNTYNYFKLF